MFSTIKTCQKQPLTIKINLAFRLAVLAFALIISGCGGGEVIENDETVEASDGTTLTVKLVDAANTEVRNLGKNQKAIISATLTSPNDSAMSNAIILFRADLAALDPEEGTGLTDGNGTATINLTTGTIAGAGDVQATATAPNGDVITASFSYAVGGVIDSSAKPKAAVNFSLTLLDEDDNETRDLKRNASATIAATLVDAQDIGIANQVITFTTNLGTVFPQTGTALTDSNGKVEITIFAGSSVGAGSINASAIINEEELRTSYSFQVLGDADDAPDAPVMPDDDGTVSKSVTGAIQFFSSSPKSIVLRNTGGEGYSEFSTITFQLIGSDGLPMEGKKVNFTLSRTTNIGGLAIDPMNAVSNSEGMVSTTLQAGSVATVVSVKAFANLTDIDGNNQLVEAYSDSLVVSSGRPDQNSFSVSLSPPNPEAWNIDGAIVEVTGRVADHYNNWVPDGTTIYFTTEGGSITPNCQTIDSACSVTWVSQEPRPSDHRVTILATTLGNESFVDTNSDGVYTNDDGEPYIDRGDNDVYDEPFIDTNGNGVFDEPYTLTGNGKWDPGEDYIDTINNRYDVGEEFTDLPDGRYTIGEEFTDLNGNGLREAVEPFVDEGNGVWDRGEAFIDAPNGEYEFGEVFTDEVTGEYKLGSPFIDYNLNGIYDGDGENGIGETSYTERNRNTAYDGAGVLASGDTLPEGYDLNNNAVFDGPGYPDLGEPYLDANENQKYDFGELYFDSNNNGIIDLTGDAKYTGILCQAGNACSEKDMLHIRASTVLIMSSSTPIVVLQNAESDITYFSNDPQITASNVPPNISGGRYMSFVAYVTDTAGQPMPKGTKIRVSSKVARLSGDLDHLVPSTNRQYYPYQGLRLARYPIRFTATDDTDAADDRGDITISVETPSGVVSKYSIGLIL